jgi:hypothetical protein
VCVCVCVCVCLLQAHFRSEKMTRFIKTYENTPAVSAQKPTHPPTHNDTHARQLA